MTPTDNEALREELHSFAVSYHVEDKVGRAADLDHMLDIITRHTQAAEVAARIDELEGVQEFHEDIGHNFPWDTAGDGRYIAGRLAELKAARPGSEGEG